LSEKFICKDKVFLEVTINGETEVQFFPIKFVAEKN